MSLRVACAVGLVVALWTAPARAGSGSGTDVGDTFVNNAAAAINNNLGGSHGIIVGTSGQPGTMHGLIRFNLPGGLTGRVTVTSTVVTLTIEGIGNTGSTPGTAATYTLLRITQNWAEGTGANDTQNNRTTGTPCAGANAASWNQANCSLGTNWTTAGGTTTGTASASASSAGLPINGVLQFSSAACSGTNLSCDVQTWIDSGNPFGWLIASSSTSPGQAQKFYSKEAGTTPPTLAFTFACKAGFKDLGSSCTTCTDAANAACVTTHVGNSCNDSGPPSTTYSCNCDLSVYRSSGTPACVIGCSPVNHCRDNGDASAACTDTASGYSCTCDPGYVLNATGTSCVDACPSTPDPCGNGTCTAGGTGWTCGCNPGYVSSGGTFAHCNDYNACNAAALADCTTHPGDACVDEAAPSMTYHCTCGNPADKVGTGADGGPACVDIDDCNPNHCVDGGDTGATCTDPGGTTLGYSCTCTSALWEQGLLGTDVTCVDVDECATGNPCGNGVCTNVGSGGGYTCACATGYVSSGGMQPTCANLDACDSAAIAACTTQPGNACVDDAPPSTGYHCTCGNPAYAAGTVAGQPACVDNNECMPNHCQDGGDSTATCADHAAPATGYDCTCDAGWSSDGTTCRDVDECAQDHLCDHGTCSNVPGSYECTCDKGYESTTDTAPVCVPVADKAGGCGCASQGGGAQALLLVLIVALARPRRRRRSRR